jgi:hypothetical protein
MPHQREVNMILHGVLNLLVQDMHAGDLKFRLSIERKYQDIDSQLLQIHQIEDVEFLREDSFDSTRQKYSPIHRGSKLKVGSVGDYIQGSSNPKRIASI